MYSGDVGDLFDGGGVFTLLPKVQLQVSALDNIHLQVVHESLRKFYFSPMPPHVLCGLRGPPSWAWQECNRRLRLGRP